MHRAMTLFRAGVAVDVPDVTGWTYFGIAAHHGHAEARWRPLAEGPNGPCSSNGFLFRPDQPSSAACSWKTAPTPTSKAAAAWFVPGWRRPSLAAEELTGGGAQTALHEAARMGHARVVKVLLQHGAVADVADAVGRTPLSLAKDADVRALLVPAAAPAPTCAATDEPAPPVPRFEPGERVLCAQGIALYDARVKQRHFLAGGWMYDVHFMGWSAKHDLTLNEDSVLQVGVLRGHRALGLALSVSPGFLLGADRRSTRRASRGSLTRSRPRP